jgi:hypothetical protein
VTDDVRIADLLAHALATSRPVDQVVLPRHLVDRLHREMAELTQRAERAEAQLPIRPDGTHHYVGTGCLHEDLVLPDGRTGHDYCEGETGACGTKIPATCKHCGAKCACPNHREQPIRPDVSGEDVSEAEIDAAMAAGEPVEIIGSPDLTLGELQDLVDEQGLDLYRAQDRLAYIAEMCDLVDRNGQAVTTARVRMWLKYEGCAGALELPEAPASVAAPATGEEHPELHIGIWRHANLGGVDEWFWRCDRPCGGSVQHGYYSREDAEAGYAEHAAGGHRTAPAKGEEQR